jgi:hypothetical protein
MIQRNKRGLKDEDVLKSKTKTKKPAVRKKKNGIVKTDVRGEDSDFHHSHPFKEN